MERDNSIERIFSDDVALSLKLRGMNDVDCILYSSRNYMDEWNLQTASSLT